MMLFSQRRGLKPIREEIQIESMDESLRTRLWNALQKFYWERFNSEKEYLNDLYLHLLDEYFKRPWKFFESFTSTSYEDIKKYFFSCDWYEAYDFIEFVANKYPAEKVNTDFMKFCNIVLKEEVSAYRFVGAEIVQITSEIEIKEIEEALNSTEPLKGVNTHLKTALKLLSDRKNPDYRNSIKESISAVESMCKIIVGNGKATLGSALKVIERNSKFELNGALKSAFTSLYGYTSDADGIRHGLLEEPNVSFEDAKFMLVSCSAFVNYLLVKTEKAGMDLTSGK